MAQTPRSDMVSIVWNGITFRRYAESEVRELRVYYSPGPADGQRGIERLHREIWKATHGPIPPGHHIHHKDHDPLNNNLDNLTCIPAGEHRKHHSSDPARIETSRRNIEIARPFAIEWHGSPAGIEWHRQHGKDIWMDRGAVTYTCEQCGAPYETRGRRGTNNTGGATATRFCSNNCKSAWRRASGVDNEQRTCQVCGNEFTANRYSRSRSCSRACGSSLRTDRKSTRL